jgi:MYXO-CTERM domain-containing protein
MRWPLLPLLFLLVGAAGCVAPEERVEKTAAIGQPIVGGWDAPDDALVVALVSADGVVCSGTLVTNRVVITAAHCGALAPTTVTIEGGSLAAPLTIPIATFNIHPEFDPQTLDNDLAIVTLLDHAPSSVSLLPIWQNPITPEFGGSGLRVVGYGRASASDAAIRQQGWVSISDIGPVILRTVPGPSQPCHGDSGGPAFAFIDNQQYLVGVISSGDPACADHANIVRTDAFLASFINPMLAAVADGAARVGERCFDPDNCVAGAQCYTGTSTSSYAYCTKSCDSTSTCLPGMTCAAQDGGGSLCLFPKPPGETGSSCIVDTDCNSVHCARRNGDDVAVCADTCIPHVIPCAGNLECLVDAAHPEANACFAPTTPAAVSSTPAHAASAPAAPASTAQETTPAPPPSGSKSGCSAAPAMQTRSATTPSCALVALAMLAALTRRRRRTAS